VGVPLTLDSDQAIGIILLGDKLSGMKYSESDIELLSTIASSAALAIKRLELQEQLIIEEIENTQLKEMSELKSYFVASVSHSFKTPLSAIKIFSELSRNDNISRERTKEFLGIIEGETGRLERMINNVLNYAKIEKGIKNYSFAKIDLNNVVNEVLEFMNYEFTMHKFDVEKYLCSNALYINGDPDAINSLIENLFSNSIKYSDENKFLKIATSVCNKEVEVLVEDKGIGISEKNLKEIFNPFYREKNTERSKIKGAGLGLSIVKNIVDAHFGNIEVNSCIGQGSIFKIRFPIYTDEN
jgi:two-component system phosphate regulon sensor histidine kinase PhoR